MSDVHLIVTFAFLSEIKPDQARRVAGKIRDQALDRSDRDTRYLLGVAARLEEFAEAGEAEDG
jgi:hypothetical protein